MIGGCLFDSNIIIYRLNDRLSPAAERIVSELLDGHVYISVIVDLFLDSSFSLNG